MSQTTSAPSQNPLRQPLPLLPPQPFGKTSRKDPWWIGPLITFLVFTTFIVYSTWAAFQGNHYSFDHYLSPFYSPELWGRPGHSWLGGGTKPSFYPGWAPYSPAFLILWGPGFFRLTCYYYRGAYYKAFWSDPLSCTVGEPRKSYLGENSLPLILQNIHRYFFYLAVIFLAFLAYDVYEALWFTDLAGKTHFGIGVGTVILAVNVCLLAAYTFGCHSLRHLIGGFIDQFSKKPARYSAWKCATCFNKRHMLFAWCSLFSVGFADLYIRLCSMGIWHDFHWSIT
jgi:hypothetical protein